MNFKIIQSCDSAGESILNISKPVNQKYAEKYGYGYESKVETKKSGLSGIYNYLYDVRDEINNGTEGWLVKLDTDSCIYDNQISLEQFISDHSLSSFSIVGTAGSPEFLGDNTEYENQWDINGGVLFFNLDHPKLPDIINYAISSLDSDYDSGNWDGDHSSYHDRDQGYLNEAIHHIITSEEDKIMIIKTFMGENYQLINYNGSFIKHILSDEDEYHIEINRDNMNFPWTLQNKEFRTQYLADVCQEVLATYET